MAGFVVFINNSGLGNDGSLWGKRTLVAWKEGEGRDREQEYLCWLHPGEWVGRGPQVLGHRYPCGVQPSDLAGVWLPDVFPWALIQPFPWKSRWRPERQQAAVRASEEAEGRRRGSWARVRM